MFHEMELHGVEPSVHTFGAMIDGCARAGQLPKAFGAYGIMISKVTLELENSLLGGLKLNFIVQILSQF